MKKLYILLTSMILVFGVSQRLYAQSFAVLADSAQHTLMSDFLYTADGNYFFNQDNTATEHFHFWWNSVALDVLIDGYLRADGNSMLQDSYVTSMKNLVDGIKKANGNTLIIDFYDDMEWLAISTFRAYQLTKATHSGDSSFFRNASDLLWTDIKTGWNTNQGGGIAWNKNQLNYKNTPSNASAVIIGARRYQNDNALTLDLDTAESIYSWLKSTLYDASTGRVWDGINRDPISAPGEIDLWEFTYNHGLFIGAAHELYKATSDTDYLDDAIKTADYVVNQSNLLKNGIFVDEGNNDAPLFKGVLARYLTLFIEDTNVPLVKRNSYKALLEDNAAAIYFTGFNRTNNFMGSFWGETACSPTQVSGQLSGAMMLEAAARLGFSSLSALIPGRISAENYDQMSGVVEETTSDEYCGQNVGGIETGEWMDYEVKVAESGEYLLKIRAARETAGTAQLQLKSGSTVLGTVDIPSTSGWQNWVTQSVKVELAAGQQTLRIHASSGGFNLNWLEFDEPINVTSNKIEAEDYSQMSGIITEGTSDVGGGLSVGGIDSGEWLEYFVDVSASGQYELSARVSRDISGTTQLQLKSGEDTLGAIDISSTGDWENWVTLTANVQLEEGGQILRVYAVSGGFNLNWIKFEEVPYTNAKTRIEAENYSNMSGVITETTTDTGGGQNVGGIDTDEWMEYMVHVDTAGQYLFNARLAREPSGDAQFQIKVGATVLGTVDVHPTGGWQNWTTINTPIDLSAGSQTIRILATTGGFNMNWFELLGDITDPNSLGVITVEHTNANETENRFKLIDNTSGTKYLAGSSSGWIQFEARQEYIVTSYAITSANDAPERDPLDWTLQGSNNGSSWTTIHSLSGEDFSSRLQRRFFTFSNTTGYVYYRLNMVNNSGSLLQFSEWELFGMPTSCPSCRTVVEKPQVDQSEELTFKLFPNPVQTGDRFILSINKDYEHASIKLIDLMGRAQLTMNVSDRERRIEVPIEGLAIGIYVLYAQFDDFEVVRKIRIK